LAPGYLADLALARHIEARYGGWQHMERVPHTAMNSRV
jgi:hypothetical protein